MITNKYQKRTFLLLACLTIIRLFLSIFIDPDGAPAYYAMWSKHLQLSYFDHPSITAILIKISTSIFGWNSFGIKFPGIIMFTVISIFIYKSIILLSKNYKGAFWAILLFNFTPWIASSFGIKGANPDIPFILFYIMSFYYFIKLYKTDNPKYWYIISFLTILGINSKYKMVFIYPSIIIASLLIPKLRHHWKTKHLYIAGFTSLLGLLPILIWNLNNNFASFSYHLIERQNPFNFNLIRYLTFLSNQLYIMGIFIPIILFKNLFTTRKTIISKLCIAFALPTLIIFSTIILFFSDAMQNWWASVYTIMFIAYGANKEITNTDKNILYFEIIIFILTTTLYIYPFIKFKENTNFLDHHLFKEATEDLKTIIKEEKYIATPRYRSTAMFNFYVSNKIIYSIDWRKKDQFQLWYNPDTLKGKDIIYITIASQNKHPNNLFKFNKLELIKTKTYHYNKFFKRTFNFYKLYNFQGLQNAK